MSALDISASLRRRIRRSERSGSDTGFENGETISVDGREATTCPLFEYAASLKDRRSAA
jgi:hypothetical protein